VKVEEIEGNPATTREVPPAAALPARGVNISLSLVSRLPSAKAG